MNPRTSHKIMVACGMAVAIGVGIGLFLMQPATVAPIVALPSPSGVAEAAPSIRDVVGPVAQVESAAPATPAADPAGPTAAEPAAARSERAAATRDSGAATQQSNTRGASAAAMPQALAQESLADRVSRLSALPTPGAGAAVPEQAQDRVDMAAADSQITADVRSAIAGSTLSKDLNVGVKTIEGVVVLTGIVATQDAIEQVKDVAAKVKDVKSVDASALILTSL